MTYNRYQLRNSPTDTLWYECQFTNIQILHVMGLDNRPECHSLVAGSHIYPAGCWRLTPKPFLHEPSDCQRVILKDGTVHTVLFRADAVGCDECGAIDLFVAINSLHPDQWDVFHTWEQYILSVGHDNIATIIPIKDNYIA